MEKQLEFLQDNLDLDAALVNIDKSISEIISFQQKHSREELKSARDNFGRSSQTSENGSSGVTSS